MVNHKTKRQKINKTNRPKSKICPVDYLVASRTQPDQSTWYLVKWTNLDSQHNNWEPEEHILDPQLIQDLKDKKPKTQWQYYVDAPINGKAVGWHDYAPLDSQSIQDKFDHYCADESYGSMIRSMGKQMRLVGQYSYKVNFIDWTQTNLSTGTVRKIRLSVVP